MNTVVTINLNGNAYQIDENGYNALKEYLAGAEIQLTGNPDRAEIMADLEQAIADKCRKFLGPNKTVITELEMKQIVQEMGPVDGAAGETGDEKAERERQASNAPKGGAGAYRRLYRIHEGSMIAGVCQGIAAYIHVEPAIVRLAFLILTIFTYGFGAILYLVLALVLPSARTPEELAAAQGKPFSAQNVIDEAKKAYEGFRNDKEWRRHWRRQRREWKRMWRYDSGSSRSALFPVFMISNFTVPLIAIVAIFALVRNGIFFGFPSPFRLGFLELALILIVITLITSPLRAARRLSYQAAAHASPLAGAWMSLLWLFCLAVGGMVLYWMVPQVHYIVDNLQDILGGIFSR